MKYVFNQQHFKVIRHITTASFAFAAVCTVVAGYQFAIYGILDSVSGTLAGLSWLAFFGLVFNILFIIIKPDKINAKNESLCAVNKVFAALLNGIGVKDFGGRKLVFDDFVNLIFSQPEAYTLFLQSLSLPARQQISKVCGVRILELEQTAIENLNQKKPSTITTGLNSEQYQNICKRRDRYKAIRQIVMNNWDIIV